MLWYDCIEGIYNSRNYIGLIAIVFTDVEFDVSTIVEIILAL